MGSKIKFRIFNKMGKLLSKFFGFEEGVDIGDDTAVLHRRNVVIKNIVVSSSFFYSALFLGLSLSLESKLTDWLFTLLSFPITFITKSILEKIISSDPTDHNRQTLASYFASGYMFLSSLFAYLRLYGSPMFETIGYVLLFYAIVVISLYQEKAILTFSFSIILIIMTVIHLLLSYRIDLIAEGLSFMEFLRVFVKTDEFIGFIMRGLIFVFFYLVVFVIVSIGQFLQEERKIELTKRREVESDFTTIVNNLFSAVLFDANLINEDPYYENKILSLSTELSKSMGLSQEEIENMKRFSIIHLRFEEIKDLAPKTKQLTDEDYEVLKSKTELGTEIVSRIQLIKKAESIINRFTFSQIRDDFVEEMNLIKPDIASHIIVFVEAYLMFRDSRPGKRPYTHELFVQNIQKDLGKFFPLLLVERFLLLNEKFNRLYVDLNDVSSWQMINY